MKSKLAIFIIIALVIPYLYGADTTTGTIKKPPSIELKDQTTPETIPKTEGSKQAEHPSVVSQDEKEQEEKQKQSKDALKNTGAVMPKIPKNWGTLVNSEMVMNTGYLAMYFEDKKGTIRIAIFEMGKKVELYKLLVFNRGKEELIPKKK
jgi:hypothetical protein